MSHTPEPWLIYDNGVYIELCGNNEKIGDVCASKYHRDKDENEVDFSLDNARRIVACVNFCDGLDTKSLESGASEVGGLFAIADSVKKLSSERDTYRDLCADLLEELKTVNASAESDWGVDKETRALITKAQSILGDSNAT